MRLLYQKRRESLRPVTDSTRQFPVLGHPAPLESETERETRKGKGPRK